MSNVDTLIFDEADRMLDMGFIDEIQKVLTFVPKQRQTLLFSATYTDEITAISNQVQNKPINVKTISTEVANNISEIFYEVENCSKLDALLNALSTYKPENVIVFANTKAETNEIAKHLRKRDVYALSLNGDLDQYQRNDILVQFANKSCPVLIATDVAARGLDIKALSMVINYDIPHNEETYTHRIGRTARAGEEGVAITLYKTNQANNANEYNNGSRTFESADTLQKSNDFEMKQAFVTLVIEGGKKDKLRAGDLLGALTGDIGINGSSIGKIDIYERQSYVAIESSLINSVHKKLANGKIKGKKFSVWILR